ncbi:MAG: thioesterase [Alteromonadaceae bacterium]|uniref:acyl-CoA thioesterase n=1 Tax=unclassified Marinobacter TaxID=83889 RepID=UPI000C3E6107|nr:thioesterase family protein [Marinobacter sp. BGYM27]MAA63493.1 thioesterase [Alteromonadaceae bacterium]MBH87380.1 thioesterase [Alteromonadaceae bacterium]MDG5499055.1 thioesterase family protein [Marinobacter sp. BGYM27]|tara:strand:+ start:99783 stop:100190 length:408 start_codon:yes stop_codon:yes gene_type:complete
MSEPGNLVHTIQIPLRWADQDANGHANNTVYFRLFEEARVTWLASENMGRKTGDIGPIIVTTSATFLKELNYPATLEVKTYAGKVGNTSLETWHDVVDATTGAKYAEGYAKIVWFDYSKRTSVPVPDKLRAKGIA